MEILLTLHSYLRYVIIALAGYTLVKAIMNKSEFEESQRKSTLFLMVSSDIMLLIGLVLYFGNGWFQQLTTNPDAMKDASIRKFSLEHALLMIIAWVLVHVAYAKVKKGVGTIKANKTVMIFVGLATVIVLVAIPWTMRPAFR